MRKFEAHTKFSDLASVVEKGSGADFDEIMSNMPMRLCMINILRGDFLFYFRCLSAGVRELGLALTLFLQTGMNHCR
jgi:hypothetical protein